jgi:hypothetical protein
MVLQVILLTHLFILGAVVAVLLLQELREQLQKPVMVEPEQQQILQEAQQLMLEEVVVELHLHRVQIHQL